MKYTSLVLIPLLAVAIVLRRDWRALWVLVIPLGVLVAWSAWNWWEYGAAHLLTREEVPLSPRFVMFRVLTWVMVLGAIAPFSVLAIPSLWRRWHGRVALILAYWACAAFFAFSVKRSGDAPAWALLRSTFLLSGLFTCLMLAYAWVDSVRASLGRQSAIRNPPKRGPDRGPQSAIFMAAWLGGAAAFIILFSPFMAVRHFLVTIPAMLLILGGQALPRIGRAWRTAALAATIALGALLGLSDWLYADAFRREAPRLMAEFGSRTGTTYHIGHWGWAWYADRAGMKQYDQVHTRLEAGDIVIFARTVPRQEFAEGDLRRVELRTARDVPWNPAVLFRTQGRTPFVGMQYNALRYPPWMFSLRPLAAFWIYDVGPPAGPLPDRPAVWRR